MSLIYLLAATGAEVRAVPGMAFRAWNPAVNSTVTFGANRVQGCVTGIGPQAAGSAMQSAAARINNAKPRAMLVTGTCGALMAGLREGAIVTYTECLFAGLAGEERVIADAELTARMTRTLGQAGIEFQSVRGITTAKVAATRQAKTRLAETGASVVDMESYVILSAAREVDVPAVVLRVVSDGVDREFPDFSRAITPEGRVNRLAAAAIAATAPLSTARLMLAQQRALRKLSLALEAVLGSNCWPDAG